MEKLKMHSLNKVENNIEKIAALFPNCITERINAEGELEHAIDFDILKQELSTEIVEGLEERYQFTWPDKKKAILAANAPINKTLRPCREESVDFDNTENLYIEGDNLEVLKLLQETYLNKIKMIYIDPPYNTGKDFVYKDKFAQTMKEYFASSGQFDGEGNRLVKNLDTNGRFHTDWLNMIYSRLKLAKDLLSIDGVICIQIDDNEYSNMKKICDEIFGEIHFMTTIAVKMSEPTGMKMAHASSRLPKLKEYILVYTKGSDILINSVSIPKEKWDDEYKTVLDGVSEEEIKYIKYVRDNEERTNTDVKTVNKILSKITYRPISELHQELSARTEDEKNTCNYANAWRIVQIVSMTGGAKNLADVKKNELKQLFYSIQTPQNKMYIIKGDYSEEVEKPRCKVLFADDYLTVNPCDFWQDIKTTGLDNEGYVDFKNGKKPQKLIERLVKLFTNSNDTVMDFFSGSGTTGNAVISLNKSENTKRKFILVQYPENIDEQYDRVDASAKKDLKKTIEFLDGINKPHLISEIGKERLRIAGKEISHGDVGFRVLKCDTSNMKDVYYTPKEYTNGTTDIFDLVDNVKEDRTDEDLLFQVMLDLGTELSSKIVKKEIAGKAVYDVAEGHIIACFADGLTNEIVTEIAKQKPSYFVTRDSALENDSVATNYEQIFNKYSPATEKRVL